MLEIPENPNLQLALETHLLDFLTASRKARFEEVISSRTRHFVVAVEDVFQEHNAGAVMRTCDCFGIQNLCVIENENNYRMAKSISKGAQKWVDITAYRNTANNSQACLDDLRSKGYQIVATTPHQNDCPPSSYDISQKSALFFGTEGEGLSETILKQADAFIRIPMVGFTESFNISVSAAIILYDLTERLRKSSIKWQLSETEQRQLRIHWASQTIPRGDKLALKFIQELEQQIS